ncbi:uncharacterized protein [Procambarus clarkii]|uniref:uncharacterized protein isoform X1 n=1 Tax=Procambarus clarkii TaxID=6728 RepID=UPI001E67480B|nr:uncharacterized protein LOC123746560 isoform X1 [Procambarus clarkii]
MAARLVVWLLSALASSGCGVQASIQDDLIFLPWDSSAVDSLPSPGNVIDDQIVEALENFREQMSIGWPDLGIPPLDPFLLASLPLNITSGETNFYGNLTEVSIKNLSNFSIDLVDSNLLFLKVDIVLGLQLLDIDGAYDIFGAIGIFPIFGDGPFRLLAYRLDAFDSNLSIEVALGVDEYDELGVSELTIYADFNTTEVDFENVMGGGNMADFVNGVLSSLAPDILRALEDEYMPLMEEALKHEINTILHGGRKNFKDDSVNEYFDYVFANMRRQIIENGEDPLGLPGDSGNFTVSLFNTTLEGQIEVDGGRLGGLSTIHRAGNMTLLYVGDEDEAVWRGEVGLIDLQVEYSFRLWLALFGKELEYVLKMAFVHLSFETDVFLHQSELTFAYCNISELGPVHFKEKGAGPLDTPLYNLLANTLVGELHALISGTLQKAVCALLENAFASG